MAEIQQCCIHGKLQLRNRPLWCQNVVLIQVFLKVFFLFSDIFFKICRESQAMASFGELPPVTNIVTIWKKQESFWSVKCLDVDLRKADNVRANTV